MALAEVPTGPLTAAELPTEQKRTENQQSVAILDTGIPERVMRLVPVSGSAAEGMVRLVTTSTKLYVVFDENVSLVQAPSLHVYVSKRASNSFADFTVAYVDLGELTSARGTQVYEVPVEMKLEEIKSIAIVNAPYQAIVAKAVID